MELILKLPKDKPPFLGIEFENIYEASKLNSHLVEQHKDLLFTIMIEISGNLNLKLVTSGELNFYYQYLNLKFDRDKLINWLNQTQKINRFNFSHLIKENDKHLVVETLKDRKLFVLKIERIILISE